MSSAITGVVWIAAVAFLIYILWRWARQDDYFDGVEYECHERSPGRSDY
jgi:hypothetical protein